MNQQKPLFAPATAPRNARPAYPCCIALAAQGKAWADSDALRATHLRIAWSGFLASVMTVAVGCALCLMA